MDAYRTAFNASSVATEIGGTRTVAGTVNAAVAAYYRDETFTHDLASETQRMRRNILERFRERYGDYRIGLLQHDHVLHLLTGMKPHAKKNWLKTIRGLMAFAIKEKLRKDDPTQGVKIKVKRSTGHMAWTEVEIEAYREHHPLGTMARLALELLLNIAARRGDVYRLGPQHVRGGKLIWRPRKTLRSTAIPVEVPIVPELHAARDAMARKSGNLTFLTNEYGRAFASAAAFGNKFADWCKEAGLRSVICDDGRTRNFRAHGLRKAACRRLAEAGCQAVEIMAVSGHASLAEAQRYVEDFNRSRSAENAVKKLMHPP